MGKGRFNRAAHKDFKAPSAAKRVNNHHAKVEKEHAMDIEAKMSFSLEDIIKKEREMKSVSPKRKNSAVRKPEKPRHMYTSKKGKNEGDRRREQQKNLQITVSAKKIIERPVLNQVMSTASLLENERYSTITRGVGRDLRERVQPISLDYRAAESRFLVNNNYHAPGMDRVGSVASNQPSANNTFYQRPLPPAAPMNIDSQNSMNNPYYRHRY